MEQGDVGIDAVSSTFFSLKKMEALHVAALYKSLGANHLGTN